MNGAGDIRRRVQPRIPMPADLYLGTLRGQTVILVGDTDHDPTRYTNDAGERYKAWGEPYERDGTLWVDVVTEPAYWMHELNGIPPARVVARAAHRVAVP